MQIDWQTRLANLKYDPIIHLVVFPFYEEGYEVLSAGVRAIVESSFPQSQIAIVLAAEERAGAPALAVAKRVQQEYAEGFFDFIVTEHPFNIPGEIIGKGSNITYATKEACRRIVDARGVAYENVIVSAFDSDTIVYPQYFSCLTWYFLTVENPQQVSFQPVPLYNNNIWNAPMLSRVLGYSSTFWQMTLQERPERSATFSSHSVSLKALSEAGFWQTNVVSEDSRIFWNLFLHYDGDYRVVPIAYPVSMDSNVGPTFWQTVVNLYKQHRRWTYGAENIPYILFNFLHNPRISLHKKIRSAVVQVEGFWSLTTHPLILFLVGWLPLFVGGHLFNATVLSYNLPIVARWFLTFAMFGLIASAIFCMYLIPKRPEQHSIFRNILMVLQWVLVPFTMIVFSAIPGLDAQVRLASGNYLGFWVTPKIREEKSAESTRAIA
jgi:hypothetical protein